MGCANPAPHQLGFLAAADPAPAIRTRCGAELPERGAAPAPAPNRVPAVSLAKRGASRFVRVQGEPVHAGGDGGGGACQVRRDQARPAERCPKALGTQIKASEVQYHHEVTNQFLWSQFERLRARHGVIVSFPRPAQRVGRSQPRAEAEGRCPGKKRRFQSLRPERSREPDSPRQLSRPFRPQRVVIPPPRASAFGLSPGLHSPDPLGRTEPNASRAELPESWCGYSVTSPKSQRLVSRHGGRALLPPSVSEDSGAMSSVGRAQATWAYTPAFRSG